MTRYAAIWATLAVMAGCKACPPTKMPEPVPVPEACLINCSYSGPASIKLNGELLEAYKAREAQVACLEARLQCVRDASAKP